MRGVNYVVISGNVSGRINFGTMGDGTEVLSFQVASDRWANGSRMTVWVKINVYIDQLVRICKTKLKKGEYVIVQGELMNREGNHGELTEVRAREILFVNGR
jgi:single-stranded DNA-binding protein